MQLESLVRVLEHASFLSAVLGGFAVTLFVSLLPIEPERKVASIAAGIAVGAAVLLGVATISGIGGVVAAILEPELAAGPAHQSTVYGAYRWTTISFMFGMLLFIGSLGACGWIRSRRFGVVTTTVACLAVGLLAYFLVFVVKGF
jgi:hypothetical protein